MTTTLENSATMEDIVGDELRHLASVRENAPARAGIADRLPQANGDQDTW
ncbi:hypothetical protein [Kutzneria sp. 744]|nr:hypothetical protein [Kutzneria sp. 744]